MFVYNRPVHTRLAIESLKKNVLASQSVLYLFSDAPKIVEATEAVNEVREYIKTVTGFKSLKIVERDKNWGLASSIIDGVSRLCNEYGRVIVLEDDVITTPFFLSFMNDALSLYKAEEKVMHISGYMFPIETSGLPETFFLRPTTCWGWATWDRAWKYFNKDVKVLLSGFTEHDIASFNMDDTYDYWEQVVQNEAGLINTWAVFWYASVFQVGGLCLHPARSLINNIGHDDTGEHCRESKVFFTTLANKPVTYFERNIAEDELARARTKEFFRSIRPSLFQRGIAYFRRKIRI